MALPLFIYYLTVPQWCWCEDQFAVLSLLLLKYIFASWTRPFPVSVPGHLVHLPLHISKDTLIFTIPLTSSLCCHFTYSHTTLILSILSFLLFQSSIQSTKLQKLWSAPSQHDDTYLDLSQPWHRSYLIQMPLRHKGGTHKVTHLLNHSAWKSTLKPEECINHSILEGVH